MPVRKSGKQVTIVDVATRAGVGVMTVSRALREPSKVSKELRKVIDKAIADLNYIPNLNARALASTRTDNVAVLVPSLTQNIFSDVIRGVYDGVEDSALRVEIFNTRYSSEVEEEQIAAILRHQPAGIIVSGIEQTPACREMLERAQCPVIQVMDMTDAPIQKIIGFSHVEAGRQMTQHLIDAGYRKIAFFARWLNGRSGGRFQGYRAALETAGLFDPDLVDLTEGEPERPHGHLQDSQQISTAAKGRAMMYDLLDRRPDADAVFCNTDVLAIGALFACNSRGVSVPEKMGIAGFNDFDYMEAAWPPLSSVRIPRWQCGYDAMLAVRRQLAGEDFGPAVVDLGFDVVRRESTTR